MGIESDQLVYDYLSRVGDAAQQQQLPSGERMRLVSTLRNEIDRQRGKFGGDSPAGVRRILGRLGAPDAVVRAAGGPRRPGAPEPLEPETPVVPPQRTGTGQPPPDPLSPGLPDRPDQADAVSLRKPVGPSAPADQPDWWRIDAGPASTPFGPPMDMTAGGESMSPEMAAAMSVPGFVGRVEVPEMLKPPPDDDDDEEEEAVEETGWRRWQRRLRLTRRGADGAGDGGVGDGDGIAGVEKVPARRPRLRQVAHPFLLLAAVLLLAGAALSWFAALAGGLLAYLSRRLSPAEKKWVVLGIPAASAVGGLVWLWGRLDGRWGEPIPENAMGQALSDTWPVAARTAAVALALYLVLRSRRR
ncbi:hypothetical protein [Streptomyces sp. NPDC051569]|uniref:hypothetical protein n=1 Tax=Streptomyces sp. NPDC051569 TaxID=3365661 RepID=UPI0037A48F35